MEIGDGKEIVNIEAPDGLIVFPDTQFVGSVLCGTADASICHFKCEELDIGPSHQPYMRPVQTDAMHVQNLIRLSLAHMDKQASMVVRQRLLQSILDCFLTIENSEPRRDKVSAAWKITRARLHEVRSLSDVASSVGLSESAFRALHRKSIGGSAGQHLRSLRLTEAERLLSTSDKSIREISNAIGYGHPESFTSAFKSVYGQTPGNFKRWSALFA